MATDNETVAEAIEMTKAIFFKDIGPVNEVCQWCRAKLKSQLDRIEAAHKRELAAKDREIARLKAYIAENDINGDTAVACLTEIKEAVEEKMAEIEKLKFDIMHLKSVQRTSGEVIIEQTNKVEAKDAKIAVLSACLKEAVKKQCKHKECKNSSCFFVKFGKENECVVYGWREALKGVKDEH